MTKFYRVSVKSTEDLRNAKINLNVYLSGKNATGFLYIDDGKTF